MIPDAELTGPRLAQEVGRLLADRSRLAAMARASAGLARPEAAAEIAAEVMRVARRDEPRGGDRSHTADWSAGGCTSSGSAAPE